MQLTRRTFLKGSAAAGASVAASRFLFTNVGTLQPVETSESSLGQAAIEEWVPTTCWIGKQDCGMLARKINGRVVSLHGNPIHPKNKGTLCPKGVGQIAALYDPNRVKTPLLRTNGKGVPGEFTPISWDEALDRVSKEIKQTREKDPKLVVWQKGRSKAGDFYDDAFVKAIGCYKMGHGAYCSDAGYRAAEITAGMHGVIHPDFRYTKYVLSWGWNIANGGGNKTCWLTWNQQLLEAMDRGIKVIAIDPRLRASGTYADKWLPIRPSTDLALALALCHELMESGVIDREFLTAHTNSTYLVKADGHFLRKDDVEQVWDEASGAAMPAGSEGITPALEGSFTVDGQTVRTSYQVMRDKYQQYTPAWAAGITGLKAEDIATVAREFGENAMIGSTIVEDGIEIPYRPVSIMTYHIAQAENGFQQLRAELMLLMLVGALGAAGGSAIDWTWKLHKNWDGLDNIELTDSPDYTLNKSKYYPINSKNPSVAAQVMNDPEKFGVSPDKIPEIMIIHHANPLGSFLSHPDIEASYHKLRFIAVIDPWISRTADLFADVILPAATMEKYEGVISATDGFVDAQTLRIPPVEPMFESRGEIDIYMDLTEKTGDLYGEDGYLSVVNKELKLDEDHALPLAQKPTVREIFDRWARQQKLEGGIEFFEDPDRAVQLKGPVSPTKRYGWATDPPFLGKTLRVYAEKLLVYQEQMKEMGSPQAYYQDYLPLPEWREPTYRGSPAKYDLDLISFHMIEFKQSRTSMIPLLAELAPRQRVDINTATAKAHGIKDGDDVFIESHNAVTNETRSMTVPAHLTEALRPDTIAVPHHYGEIARHPWTKGQGASPNSIFFTGEGYTSMTADQSYHVMVRVQKA